MTAFWPPDLTFTVNVPASLATGDPESIIGRSRYTGVVTSVEYIPTGDVTGVSGDNRTLTVVNHGGSGSGTVEVATLPLTSGADLEDNVPREITLATGVARYVEVGDVLAWTSTHQSAGVADPGGQVIVQMALR